MDTKQKFVRLKEYNEVIIFPCVIEHSRFQHFNPITAGFCYVNADKNRVYCFGESYSLGLKSDPKQDTIEATKQIFGIEACLELIGSNDL